MEVRKIKQSEYTKAKELIDNILHSEFPEDADAYPLEDLKDIDASYGHLAEAFFVAVDDKSNLIGTVAVKREDDRTAFLRRIFVDPNSRGKQIGKKLIKRAIDFCQEVGYEEIIFKTTSRMQSAIKLCEKYGFVERAKLDLGAIELLKFTLFLKEYSV